jgi:hypothetical protein
MFDHQTQKIISLWRMLSRWRSLLRTGLTTTLVVAAGAGLLACQPAAPPPAPVAAVTPPAPPTLAEDDPDARAVATRAPLFEALEAILVGEPVDPAWAPGAIVQVRAAVAKHAASGTIRSVRCSATLCRVTVGHRQADDVNSFVADFSVEPLLKGQIVIQYAEATGTPITTIWLTRKGHNLPRPPHS